MKRLYAAALLFDLDGTLADTRDDLYRSVNFTLNKLGRPAVTMEQVTAYIGDGMGELLKRALGSEDETLVGQALSLFRPHYFAHCADQVKAYPGVAETLQRFPGMAMAVVTNKPEDPSWTVLRALNLEKFFKTVIGGDTLPARKPSPEPLLEAARRLGRDAGRAVMVGDSPGDVAAGKAAGMGTCAVTYGYRPKEVLSAARPDALIDTFSDLQEVIQ